MKIIITGNMGYVGSSVVSHLRGALPDATIVGVDSALFGHCLTQYMTPERKLDVQVFRDVRDPIEDVLSGADVVVHLAAISNDPMGLRFGDVTKEVNQSASIRIAELAARNEIKRFVFASSCSIYGFADGAARSEGDALNPLTAYAQSKVGAEVGLHQIAVDSEMHVCALRFATACGFSGRTRLDLVLNDFVASALSTGRISVLSDGTPWRPLIHLNDMARAIEWAIVRPLPANECFLPVNVGSDEWNYQVADLAAAVRSHIPGTTIEINKDAQPDKRSYRVDFSRYKSIAPNHQPRVSLGEAIRDIRDGLLSMNFKDAEYRQSNLIRFNVLDEHLRSGRIHSDLRWSAIDRYSEKSPSKFGVVLRTSAG
ncbi:NAD-dependent epimerase/dehydratase family protein [Microvirga tunisiensis]|uniref:SDR family oxidoreductase n=1 Tax=Microvirga tunisiensis TaxID=2108360 RepID=A0A5N7MVQ4_9HYPH|nr:SDR family oxidoreductase [Microvirga tunisiensis]MPR13140.1 SDR family oxidoreductase [Microvirga tunisiensis]MPR31021.1 SDR family oxidoreductase [Microvirga tunisiensis]